MVIDVISLLYPILSKYKIPTKGNKANSTSNNCLSAIPLKKLMNNVTGYITSKLIVYKNNRIEIIDKKNIRDDNLV